MNPPNKKRVAALTVTLMLAISFLLTGLSSYPTREETISSAPVESQEIADLPVAVRAGVDIPEAIAAHASEVVEVIPTLDRTKPIYEVYKNGFAVAVDTDLQWYIRDMCLKYDFPEKYIYGMILCESTFQADAKNGNCLGLAQINKFWITRANITHFTDDYSSRDLCNAYDNILTLFEMWVYCRDTYGLNPWNEGDMLKILYWHNTGKDPSKVTKWAYATKAFGYADELVPLQ